MPQVTTPASTIDQNIQLELQWDGSYIPVRDFEFTVNGDNVEIDTLTTANAGYHNKILRFALSFSIYQVGGYDARQALDMQIQRKEFTLVESKYTGRSIWAFTGLQWNRCRITSIRGTGMAPDQIPLVSVTAKALELAYYDSLGVLHTVGHAIDGSG